MSIHEQGEYGTGQFDQLGMISIGTMEICSQKNSHDQCQWCDPLLCICGTDCDLDVLEF